MTKIVRIKRMYKKTYVKVFVAALLFNLVIGVLQGFRPLLYMRFHHQYKFNIALCVFYQGVQKIGSEVLVPLLAFFSLYLLGKRINLRSTYIRVCLSLIVAGALGHYFGYSIGYLLPSYAREFWAPYRHILWQMKFHSIKALHMFFLGFTALTISYFKNKPQGQEERSD